MKQLFTPVIVNEHGAQLWLCDTLMGESFRLEGEHETGEILAKSDPGQGIGMLATDLVFHMRSDGRTLNWCGLPFRGDVLNVAFSGDQSTRYTPEQLDAWATPLIWDRLPQSTREHILATTFKV